MTQFKNILCPIDFSEDSKSALREASALARGGGGRLVVLHVIEPIIYPVEYGMAPVTAMSLESTVRKNAQERLDEIIGKEVGDGVDVSSRITFGNAQQEICKTAEEGGFDLIVLATHGLTGLKHMLMGSVAERVVQHADCPVLTVKKNRRGAG